ncbi:hypothetical protein T484DRAFT_1962043, partial [Baffinella frigidus]
MFGGAFLPVCSRTARRFVALTQCFLLLMYLTFSVAFLLHGLATGDFFMFFFWTPWFFAMSLVLLFRLRFFGRIQSAVWLLAWVVQPPARCVAYDYLGASSYGECVATEYRVTAPIIGLFVWTMLSDLAATVAKHTMARRAFKASRDLHRALWREELSKVAGSPEVLDGLRGVADGIARELLHQRRQALRSLAVVARLKAFAYERVGRWSLRGSRGKLRLGEAVVDPGMALKRGPIKKPARALQKLVRLYGRDVAMLTDLVRCTVVAEDLREVEALITRLHSWSVVGLAGVVAMNEEGSEEELVELNTFDPRYDDASSGGYRDLSISVEVGWVMEEGLVSFKRVRDWEALECQRHICEIQVHLRSQHAQITEGLHK